MPEVLTDRIAAVRVPAAGAPVSERRHGESRRERDHAAVVVAAELADCLERFLAARADEPTMERAEQALEAWRALVDDSAPAAERQTVDIRDGGARCAVHRNDRHDSKSAES